MALKRIINKTIGTHNGSFHCDEALAVFMLKNTKEFKHANIIRTRNPKYLAECDVIVDVGGIFDPSQHRYDHHQDDFAETFSKDYKITLSSAGLVYKHFGKEVIGNILENSVSESEVDMLFQKTYKDFVESLDANDNGINAYPKCGMPIYKENPTNIVARIRRLNPNWNQYLKEHEMYARFSQASALAGAELVDFVQEMNNSWIPAHSMVLDAIKKRYELDSSGRIIALDLPCPWKEHLMDIEEKLGLIGDKSILYVIAPHTPYLNAWRVHCVPKTPTSYNSRKQLPSHWRGFCEGDLIRASGIDDCTYVHENGYIGGSTTRNGAYKMARAALEY